MTEDITEVITIDGAYRFMVELSEHYGDLPVVMDVHLDETTYVCGFINVVTNERGTIADWLDYLLLEKQYDDTKPLIFKEEIGSYWVTDIFIDEDSNEVVIDCHAIFDDGASA